MALRFTVLASGSGGNATLVECGDAGLLIDAGLGPRQLASRLGDAGASWSSVAAVLLTHTHSDHWKDSTLTHLLRRHIPLYCHPSHHRGLETWARAFVALKAAGLVRDFDTTADFAPAPGLRCRALPIRHDGGATFGFRVEGGADLFGHACAAGYVADLGCWDDALADALAEVDLLAVEFNHDIALECSSGRTPSLIARVLGDEGHLSNEQAAGLLRAVLGRSTPGRLRHVVQLHLSRDCNHPSLAAGAARAVLADLAHAGEVHTASQDRVCSSIELGTVTRKRRPTRRPSRPAAPPTGPRQTYLPGLENGD